jgi:hypothetical protein
MYRLASHSINFIVAHDGFTLHDLVSYNQKHNEANGEDGKDGTNDNLSWNCGVEGSTDDMAIKALRWRQMRNFHLALMISQGTPMVLAGMPPCGLKFNMLGVLFKAGYYGFTEWLQIPSFASASRECCVEPTLVIEVPRWHPVPLTLYFAEILHFPSPISSLFAGQAAKRKFGMFAPIVTNT